MAPDADRAWRAAGVLIVLLVSVLFWGAVLALTSWLMR